MPTFDEDVVINGQLRVARSGDGELLLHLATERGWVFRQHGTGKTTALELTASDTTNNNKDFIITTDGRVHVSGGVLQVSRKKAGAVLLHLDSERGWVFRQRGTGKTTALELTAKDPKNNNKDFVISTDGRVHLSGASLQVSKKGAGAVLLHLDSERGWVFRQHGTGATTALELTAKDPKNNNKNFIISTTGNVGIGTTTPSHKLHVNGSIKVEDDVVLAGADCAEEFDLEEASLREPGAVMVIGDGGRLHHCARQYDRRVAGVLSGAGDRRPGILLGRRPGGEGVPLALTGTAQCLVDATESPVEVGDLLTTSAMAGHAMRATDAGRSFGSTLGKALGSMSAGTGLVPVLVNLH